MSSHRRSALSIAAAFSLMGASQAFGGFINWSNASGSASFFDWSGGGSDSGFFGDPTVNGAVFTFTPTNFRADSANGAPGLRGDRAQVDISAHAGFLITGVRVTEIGEYGISQAAGTTQVAATGSLLLTNLDVFQTLVSPLVTTPGSPILTGSGGWAGLSQVNITPSNPPGWANLRLVLTNNMLALSINGTTSFIFKNGVNIEILPAPGSGALLALGGLLATRRRR